jgi:serine/threonine-protein kinase
MSEVMTSRIGRFEILESLGDSVAGNHYRAFDPATNRNVAVETFRLGTLPGDAARDAFVQGLKRSAQLLHPRIASVFDVGVDNDLAYVVSEDLTGTTLDRSILEYGPFDLAEIAPVIRQIGAALDYAHAQGIVHGGLEPERILLLENGDVKVMGFGTNFPEVKTSHGAHTFVGDPKYFSPERVRGEALTHRADIFSFGTIVYELLTGQAPFDSDSLITSLYRVVNEPHRAASEIRANLPDGIDEALGYALEKHPKDRYLSCATLIDSLEALIPAPEPAAAPASVPDVEKVPVEEAIQYCDQCGSELQTKMKFCWSCGATVVHVAEAHPVTDAGTPAVVDVAAPVPSPSAERNVVKIEAVPVPVAVPVSTSKPTAMVTAVSEPVVAGHSETAAEVRTAPTSPERSSRTEPVKVADAPPVKVPDVPVAPSVASSSASTSKSNAVRSRPTVPMEAVVEVLGELPEPLEVKVPARTEVAHAVATLPPPLSGYAMSTGTKDLPAPGAPIDAAPAKPSFLRAMLPLLIFVLILLAFGVLGFLFAPRFLSPKVQPPPPPAVEAPVAGEGQQSSTESAPAAPASDASQPAPAAP